MNEAYSTIRCTHLACTARIKNNRWGKTKAVGWFFTKSGHAWCPEHIPSWVEGWRVNKTRRLVDGS